MSKHITIRMNDYYEWTTRPVSGEAPNNTVKVRLDDDGTVWFEEILVCNINPADLRELMEFVETLKLS
jgi:hypothetical protein